MFVQSGQKVFDEVNKCKTPPLHLNNPLKICGVWLKHHDLGSRSGCDYICQETTFARITLQCFPDDADGLEMSALDLLNL